MRKLYKQLLSTQTSNYFTLDDADSQTDHASLSGLSFIETTNICAKDTNFPNTMAVLQDFYVHGCMGNGGRCLFIYSPKSQHKFCMQDEEFSQPDNSNNLTPQRRSGVSGSNVPPPNLCRGTNDLTKSCRSDSPPPKHTAHGLLGDRSKGVGLQTAKCVILIS